MHIEGEVENANPMLEKWGKRKPGWTVQITRLRQEYDRREVPKEHILCHLCVGVNHFLSQCSMITTEMRELT